MTPERSADSTPRPACRAAADRGRAVLYAASACFRRRVGRLCPRSINLICEQIGRWRDAGHADPMTSLWIVEPPMIEWSDCSEHVIDRPQASLSQAHEENLC